MNQHADGCESDEIIRSVRHLCEKYKELDKENIEKDKEIERLKKEIERLKKENANGIKFTWQNFLYYFIKMNWNINDHFTLTNVYSKCTKNLQNQ